MWLIGRESTCQVKDLGLIPGSGRSLGEGNGNPLQYSCLLQYSSHGQRSLEGYNPWGRKESDTYNQGREGMHRGGRGSHATPVQPRCMLLPREVCSVQFSRSVMPNSFQPHGLQHARLPCPSPTLRLYSNSCPFSQ